MRLLFCARFVPRCTVGGELGVNGSETSLSSDLKVAQSSRLPGGDLISAVLDREVMGLADRGGASNLVGDRWADVVAEATTVWPSSERPVPGGDAILVEVVHRLDAEPGVAAAASRRGLQNPDLLLAGRIDGRSTIQAADAKFSVETARSKQVSVEVVQALLALRGEVPGFLPEVNGEPVPVPGVFVCPDFPLTHLMLKRRHGIVRTTVRADEVVLVPAPSDVFFGPLPGAGIMAPLAAADALPVGIGESLLAGLYYFRLARATVGFWLDATKPLLLCDDAPAVDEAAIAAEAARRAPRERSALTLVRHWNADVQTVRDARAAVDHVAALPFPTRDLKPLVARVAAGYPDVPPPSLNKVRRRVGAWYRRELRERVGPLAPPVDSLPVALDAVAAAGREVGPRLPAEAERIVVEMLEATRDAEATACG